MEKDKDTSHVRTSVVLTSPFDINPKDEAERRRTALQRQADELGYFSVSELVRDIADERLVVMKAKRPRRVRIHKEA